MTRVSVCHLSGMYMAKNINKYKHINKSQKWQDQLFDCERARNPLFISVNATEPGSCSATQLA